MGDPHRGGSKPSHAAAGAVCPPGPAPGTVTPVPTQPLVSDVAALLFDNDGVLVDSTDAGDRAWTRWAEEHGQDPAVVLPMIHGRRAADTIALLLPADEVAAASDRINALELETAVDCRAIPGALDLLSSLGDAPWAVATSAIRPLAIARLEAAGLPVPHHLVTADDVEAGKPAPDPYLAAARALGVDPADCVVLEDAPAGVEAGNAAGARVIGVGLPAGTPGAWAEVADLRGVRAVPQAGRVRLEVG